MALDNLARDPPSFGHGGRALRAWDPARGLSLDNFVGLLAQHQVASIMRTGRSCPWIDLPTETKILEQEPAGTPAPDHLAATRETLQSLMSRLVSKLSPRGLDLFWRLLVREEAVDTVCVRTGMTAEAVYAWRSRLSRVVRSLAAESPQDGGPSASGGPGAGLS